MSDALERVHAAYLLRLLVHRDVPPGSTEHVDWSILLSVAAANNVLLRVAGRLEELGTDLPEEFARTVSEHRERARAIMAVVGRVTQICSEQAIDSLFPKAFQHYPDFGRDIDLLLLSHSAEIDALLTRPLGATRVGATLENWLAGATVYRIPGCSALLDIHHGRLGSVGEDTGFPAVLFRRRRVVSIDGSMFEAPAQEDQLVLQGMQRLYGRSFLRLSDVVYTCATVRSGDLDWDHVVATARSVGAFHGLSCYLSYADQIYTATFGTPLLPPRVRRLFTLGGWGRVEFRAGGFRYPSLRVGGSLYARKFVSQLAAGDWDAAGRVCLLPLVAVAGAIRRAPRFWTRPRPDVQIPELASHVAS